jgi:hypothetical protein
MAFIQFYMFGWLCSGQIIFTSLPSNVGLLGCLFKFRFLKPKTAKYAGNWDQKQKQPWSYRLQNGFSAILLTQKHAGLVYGEWKAIPNIHALFLPLPIKKGKKLWIP